MEKNAKKQLLPCDFFLRTCPNSVFVFLVQFSCFWVIFSLNTSQFWGCFFPLRPSGSWYPFFWVKDSEIISGEVATSWRCSRRFRWNQDTGNLHNSTFKQLKVQFEKKKNSDQAVGVGPHWNPKTNVQILIGIKNNILNNIIFKYIIFILN